MDWMNEMLLSSGTWLRGHVAQLSLGIMAAMLVVFGSDFNRMVQGALQGFNLPVRLIAYGLVCIVVYGGLAVFLMPWLAHGLLLLDPRWLLPLILVLALLLGLITDRR